MKSVFIKIALARLFTDDSTRYIEMLQKACEKYSLGYQLKSESYEILINWAAALSKLARFVIF